MSNSAHQRCECLVPDCDANVFHETDIGVDVTNSGFSNVSLFDCRYCGSRWLHYAIGDGVWSQSARWYRGPISFRQSRLVTAENAAHVLASLSWYFYGGCNLEVNARRGCGPIVIDRTCDVNVVESIEGVA